MSAKNYWLGFSENNKRSENINLKRKVIIFIIVYYPSLNIAYILKFSTAIISWNDKKWKNAVNVSIRKMIKAYLENLQKANIKITVENVSLWKMN